MGGDFSVEKISDFGFPPTKIFQKFFLFWDFILDKLKLISLYFKISVTSII